MDLNVCNLYAHAVLGCYTVVIALFFRDANHIVASSSLCGRTASECDDFHRIPMSLLHQVAERTNLAILRHSTMHYEFTSRQKLS